MGDYNDLRRSAATGIPEEDLHTTSSAEQRSARDIHQPPPRLVTAIRGPRQGIELRVGPGLFVLADKEALAVIEQLAKALRG